jgi:hypothetical protein
MCYSLEIFYIQPGKLHTLHNDHISTTFSRGGGGGDQFLPVQAEDDDKGDDIDGISMKRRGDDNHGGNFSNIIRPSCCNSM